MASTSDREPPPAPVRITFLFLSALGDLIRGLPLAAEARRCYPGAHLILVCERREVAAFVRELRVADQVVLLPPHARRSPLALARSLQLVHRLHPHLTFQTFASHGSFANLLAGATRAPIRCGFQSGRLAGLLTHRIPLRDDRHLLLLNLDLLRRLGHVDVTAPTGRFLPPVEQHAPRFPPAIAAQEFGRFVTIGVGSDPKLMAKRWPDRKWARLSAKLSAAGLNPVFVGSQAEREQIQNILVASGGEGVNLAGETTFADLAGVILASQVVIATEGMILHLAGALGKRSVGIYGPTQPKTCGPWGTEHDPIYLGLPCSPCYGALTAGHSIRCRTYECLGAIREEAVFEKVIRALAPGTDALSEQRALA